MVKLTKIYTRTGDDGTTGLASGARVRKDDLRVETYGTVDEANAAIGVAITHAGASASHAKLRASLQGIQHDLFDLGADLATPISAEERAGSGPPRLRIQSSQTDRLEPMIDAINENLGPLTSFVLPGGSPLAASLHLARTIVRRAERLAVSLHAAAPDATSMEPVRYLNRLSDLIFVMARAANDDGKADVLWVPGANRTRT
ncbi:MAG: cob(I)yrinic acid a,c-diamide adenosyltransferase [Phycisphaerales bacterium]|nr:MAG: cob(I)yrinic acid a,c-diamide adenosyltransferase [Phycisphaerales bacterium]